MNELYEEATTSEEKLINDYALLQIDKTFPKEIFANVEILTMPSEGIFF